MTGLVSAAVGRGLATFGYGVLRIRRRVVEEQLAASFPERDADWVRRTARACYRHFGRELAVFAGGRSSIRRASETIRGSDRVLAALRARGAGSRGLVIVSAHIGNWELESAAVASAGIPVTTVVQRQRGWNRRLLKARRRWGAEIVHRDEGAMPLLRALRRGRTVGLLADQYAPGGVTLPFLGRPTRTTVGPARLARATDTPLAFMALVRDGAGYRWVMEWVPDETLHGEGPVEATRLWLRALERAIRERPEQYFWFHRRWKGTGDGTAATAGGNQSGAPAIMQTGVSDT